MWYCRKCKRAYSKIYVNRRKYVYDSRRSRYHVRTSFNSSLLNSDVMLECGCNGENRNIVPLYYYDMKGSYKRYYNLMVNYNITESEFETMKSEFDRVRTELKGMSLLKRMSR